MTDIRYPDVTVQLVGEDSNGFMIVARVGKLLRKAGASPDEIAEFRSEATSGDYIHLLDTVTKWVNVE